MYTKCTRALGWLIPLLGIAACAHAQTSPAVAKPDRVPDLIPTGYGAAVDHDVERVRAATARFEDSKEADDAGYVAGKACVEHQPDGAMGYHHQNASLLDDRIDVEHPEMLVYERTADGRDVLTGVEYIVPFSAWTSDEPPTVMGQKLERAPSLGIWYRHVWVWRPNPSGLFADWNPDVTCHPS